jgi:hypothetical protein
MRTNNRLHEHGVDRFLAALYVYDTLNNRAAFALEPDDDDLMFLTRPKHSAVQLILCIPVPPHFALDHDRGLGDVDAFPTRLFREDKYNKSAPAPWCFFSSP